MGLDVLALAERERVERTFAALEAHGMKPLFAADRREALAVVLSLIPQGASVAHGSSSTLHEIGFVHAMQDPSSGRRYLNAEWLAENDAARRRTLRGQMSLSADYFLGSVQAVCESGEAIACDMTGSRQAFYIFGPPHVIWVAGINKLVPTVADGIRRANEVALPLEDLRMKWTGFAGSAIGKLVIYQREVPGRITLVLVNESLGY